MVGQPDSLSEGDTEDVAVLARVSLELGGAPGEARAVSAEVLSPPRVAAVAERFPGDAALAGGASDLRPGPDGRAWDFGRLEYRAEAERRAKQDLSYLLRGSRHVPIGAP